MRSLNHDFEDLKDQGGVDEWLLHKDTNQGKMNRRLLMVCCQQAGSH